MANLTEKSAKKLQSILSKKIGRELSPAELEEAYVNLMDFAYSLSDLNASESADEPQLAETETKGKLYLVN